MRYIIWLGLVLIAMSSNAQNRSMDNIKYFYKPPSDLTTDEVNQLVALIYQAGENTKENILPKIKAAKEIIFAKKGNEIMSTITMKQPSEAIREDIFKRANSPVSYKDFLLETGFWVTKTGYQQQSIFKTMLQKQMEAFKSKKIYCILNNQDGINLMVKTYGFKVVGSSFTSRKSGKLYKLLIKV